MTKAEREIREALVRLDAGEFGSGNGWNTACRPTNIDALLTELDRLRQWKVVGRERLERERDEARTERDALRAALTFYATGGHFILSDESAWGDTVSGEGENWWCDEAGTATVEDGSIAKGVLVGEQWASDVLAQIEQERGEPAFVNFSAIATDDAEAPSS